MAKGKQMTNCKTCKVCKKQKRFYQFRENYKSRDGHRHTCRKCEDNKVVEVGTVSDRIRDYFKNLMGGIKNTSGYN